MATFTQRESGNWQAKVRRDGHPTVSKSFQTKGMAEAWARSVEREMDTGSFLSTDQSQKLTFQEIASRYETEV